MAKRSSSRKKKKAGIFQGIVDYFRETRAELRKVHWPTREEAKNLTSVVLIVTIAMAVFLGMLDWLFSMELRGLVMGDIVALVALGLVVIGTVAVIVVLNRQRV